jgi:hypothetical protein
VAAEGKVNRLRVRCKAVCRNLGDVDRRGSLPCVVVGLMRRGERQPGSQVPHESTGVVGDSLAEEKRRKKFCILIHGRPKVHIPNVVALGFLPDGQPRLLLENKGPNLVTFQVVQVQAPELPVHVVGTPRTEGDEKILDCGPMNAGQSDRRPEGVALDEVLEDFESLRPGENVCHGEIPFCSGSR